MFVGFAMFIHEFNRFKRNLHRGIFPNSDGENCGLYKLITSRRNANGFVNYAEEHLFICIGFFETERLLTE